MKFSCLIVDDEPKVCHVLEAFLREIPLVGSIRTFNSSELARSAIILDPPDLVFVDLNMPILDGISLIREMRSLGICSKFLIISGHPEHALEALKLEVADFILKPFNKKEIAESLLKVVASIEGGSAFNSHNKPIRINTRSGFYVIRPDDVVLIKASGNYSEIVLTSGESRVVTLNLGRLEEIFPSQTLYRVSRSHIINLSFLAEVNSTDNECILQNDKTKYKIPAPSGKLQELRKKFKSYLEG